MYAYEILHKAKFRKSPNLTKRLVSAGVLVGSSV